MQINKTIATILRRAGAGRLMVPYLILVIAFSQCFGYIERYYIRPECTCDSRKNYPVDMYFFKNWDLRGVNYVRFAARNCYDREGYFRTFFRLDLIFPLIYTFLMFSMLDFSRPPWGRTPLTVTIWAAAIFDYAEDFSFARYLCTGLDGYAVCTTICTAIKTCLIVFNGVACILFFWRYGNDRYSRWAPLDQL